MSTPPVTTPPTTSSTGLPTGQSLNNMFLQLLVAQLQNQDPTDPVDPSQFVGQLAQFSELSEVTSIYTLLQQYVPASGSTGSSATPPAANGSANAATSGAANAAPPRRLRCWPRFPPPLSHPLLHSCLTFPRRRFRR
jgi:hypothetical protein